LSVLAEFIYLQVLDLLTTLAFITYGIAEVNPVVKWAMRESPSAFGGLFLVKVAAVLLAIYCMAHSKQRLLRGVNIFFAGVVAYNVVVLIINAPVLR
jgi:hypothetical protein